jgi:CHAT domain-containing protein
VNQGDYNEQRVQQEFLQTIELCHALYNQLLAAMAGYLEKVNRLYIVPDEFLYALPFNTLAIQDGIKPDFLIRHKAIMYLPATSMYTHQAEAVNSLSHSRFLASVDTTMYGGQEIASYFAGLLNKNLLLRTRWQSQVEIERSLADGGRAYFFYAHAEANWDDPWQSFIQFPLDQPRQYGKLTYADIDSIDCRKTGLVILAGCETTGNRIYSGAGLSGMQRSFWVGGATQVLATLWKVDAAQVTFQMSEFLKHWNVHGDAMQALQTMQQAAIAKLEKDFYLKYPHPRYWGAYNLTGTPLVPYSPYNYADRFLR